jgi:signal transduction histidine kinase
MAKRPGNKTLRSSGLGLYIAKVIIDGHDGKIGFDTEKKQGTAFYFRLPVVDADQA